MTTSHPEKDVEAPHACDNCGKRFEPRPEGGGILGYQLETGYWQRPGLFPTFLYCNKACGEQHRRKMGLPL